MNPADLASLIRREIRGAALLYSGGFDVDHPPTFDTGRERAVVAALACGAVTPSELLPAVAIDCWSPFCRLVWDTVETLTAAKVPIDAAILYRRLQPDWTGLRGDLTAELVALYQCAQGGTSPETLREEALRIHADAHARRLCRYLRELDARIRTRDLTFAEAVGELAARVKEREKEARRLRHVRAPRFRQFTADQAIDRKGKGTR